MGKTFTSFCVVAALFGAASAMAAPRMPLSSTLGLWKTAIEERSEAARPAHAAAKLKQAPSRSAYDPQTEFTATEASFYYSGEFENGVGGYWLFLSTAGMDKGNPTHDGQMARIFLMAAPPADGADPALPTGTFTPLQSDDPTAGCFYGEASEFMDVFVNPDDPASGELVGYVWTPEGGTVSVTADDRIFNVTLEWEAVQSGDESGEKVTCKASFTGAIPYDDINAYTPLGGNRDVDITGVSGRYNGDGNYSIAFYNVPLDEDGFIIGAGDLLNLELFATPSEHMEIADMVGVYTPVDVFEHGPVEGRFMQGVWYNMFGSMYAAIGTALTVYNPDGSQLVGLGTDGTVEVAKASGEKDYSVKFDLTTPEGDKIAASWTGPLEDFITDFTVDDALEDVEAADYEIAGGQGCVTAPAGASVYTITGIETGRENLPAGIYVVRCGSVVEKVIVR